MQYDLDRTKQLLGRMIRLGNIIQPVTVGGSVLSACAAGSMMGVAVSGDSWWFFGLAGALVGYGLGSIFGAWMVITIEWMAQMLIAQDAIVFTRVDKP